MEILSFVLIIYICYLWTKNIIKEFILNTTYITLKRKKNNSDFKVQGMICTAGLTFSILQVPENLVVVTGMILVGYSLILTVSINLLAYIKLKHKLILNETLKISLIYVTVLVLFFFVGKL